MILRTTNNRGVMENNCCTQRTTLQLERKKCYRNFSSHAIGVASFLFPPLFPIGVVGSRNQNCESSSSSHPRVSFLCVLPLLFSKKKKESRRRRKQDGVKSIVRGGGKKDFSPSHLGPNIAQSAKKVPQCGGRVRPLSGLHLILGFFFLLLLLLSKSSCRLDDSIYRGWGGGGRRGKGEAGL